MSVAVAKTDGVTVLTVTSDPESRCPPVCQVLKGLCYSPVCCSVSQHLRRVQIPSQSVLGTLHIMVGLLCIGLGLVLFLSHTGSWWQMQMTGFPFWLGCLFVLFGFISILSEKCPSQCLVIVSVILNLAGVAFAITAIVLYSINLGDICVIWGYGWDSWGSVSDCDYDSMHEPPSSHEESMRWKCVRNRELAMMLLISINSVLIILSVLELCITISSAVMGIKALKSAEKRGNKSNDDLEPYKTLQEDVSSNSTA